MKSDIVLSIFLVGSVLFHVEGLKSEADEMVYCKHKMHYIVSPMTTCCKTMVVKPGINLDTHWEECAVDTSADTAQKSVWAVYSCILKKYNDGEDSISLAKFAELMTKDYPEDVKTKITEEISSLDGDLTDSKSLNKVRVSYFDVEQEVCGGMPSSTKQYGKDRKCMTWEEEIHRGGRCCETTSYPFDIGFKSYMGMESTETSESTCPKLMENFEALGITNIRTMTSSILEMCDLTCEMIKSGILGAGDLNSNQYENAEHFKMMADNLLPKFLSSSVKQSAIDYALGKFEINQTIERINEFEFVDTIGGNSSTERIVHFAAYVLNNTKNSTDGQSIKTASIDFSRRKFPNNVKHIPVLCTAYKEIVLFMQLYLETQMCENLEGSETESEPESNSGDSDTDTAGGVPETAETE